MSAPKASFLLPAFDAEATLELCLRSLARQSEPDFECVVVDDGSRDATAAVARRFAATDERFRLVSAPHVGIVGALERGLATCRAPVVVRMDADDIAHRRRLQLQLSALDADRSLCAVGTHVRLFPRAALAPARRAYEGWLNGLDSPADVRRDAFVECPVAHPTLAVRREVLERVSYRDMGWPEDYDLVLRLLEAGERIGVVPRRLLGWRDGPSRLSRTSEAYALDRFTACRAHFLARGFLACSVGYVLWGYGGTGRALRRALAACGKHPRYIIEVHRGRLGNVIHGAPVVPPAALAGIRDLPIVVSVAGGEARALIRFALSELDFVEVRDFVCCA